MPSFKAHFGKGVAVAIVLGIVFGIASLGLQQFFNAAGFLVYFIGIFGFKSWVIKPISYIVILVLIWMLGLKSSDGIKWIFGKLLKKKEDRKFLFCVRIPNVLSGYPVGLVSKVYFDKKKDKIVYNIVFPNLGGMWTFICVPAEDTERAEESVEEVLLTSFSAGFL